MDDQSFNDLIGGCNLPPILFHTLEYSNLCNQMLRAVLRLSLRRQNNLCDLENDEKISLHLTGTHSWSPLTKHELLCQLASMQIKIESFNNEELNNDLFFYTMNSLLIAIDQFMYDNQNITSYTILEDVLLQAPAGFTVTQFRRFLREHDVPNDPFLRIIKNWNLIVPLRQTATVNLSTCPASLFNSFVLGAKGCQPPEGFQFHEQKTLAPTST